MAKILTTLSTFRPFNLKEALGGHQVVTAAGEPVELRKIEQPVTLDDGKEKHLIGFLFSPPRVIAYTLDGKRVEGENTSDDLFLVKQSRKYVLTPLNKDGERDTENEEHIEVWE